MVFGMSCLSHMHTDRVTSPNCSVLCETKHPVLTGSRKLFPVDTACARNALSGHWYNFDDSSVSSITEEAVVVSIAEIFL